MVLVIQHVRELLASGDREVTAHVYEIYPTERWLAFALSLTFTFTCPVWRTF